LMRKEWDVRARENARHYVDTSRTDWTDDTFFASGQQAINEDILTDMVNICQGKDPKSMRIIEIGCGAGRLTQALSKVFGEVYAVDVSGEMVAQAKAGHVWDHRCLPDWPQVRWVRHSAPRCGRLNPSIALLSPTGGTRSIATD